MASLTPFLTSLHRTQLGERLAFQQGENLQSGKKKEKKSSVMERKKQNGEKKKNPVMSPSTPL